MVIKIGVWAYRYTITNNKEMEAVLYLPQGIPCAPVLHACTYLLSNWRENKKGLRVLLLNLMPVKADTEMDIARMLKASGLDVQLLPMKISGQRYKTTPMEHMERFYLDFEEYEPYYFDRMIITGAPLEQMAFEDVRYWPQLQHIMHWADEHVERTLYICWAAQAGLYEHYGVHKHELSHKMFGVFTQQVLCPESFLMRGLQPSFKMPNSRHTEVRAEEIAEKAGSHLLMIAASDESGVGVVASKDGRRTFIVGHLEYAADTLDREYHRDLDKHLPIQPPRNYYKKDGSVDFSWQTPAVSFYRNWLQ